MKTIFLTLNKRGKKEEEIIGDDFYKGPEIT